MKIPRLLTIACLVTTFVTSEFAAEPNPVANQESRKFKRKITRTVSSDYLVYLPPGYAKAKRGNSRGKDAKWPLILFLHGAGERGTNVALVTVHGPPKIVKSRPDLPFIVVSPQCPPGQVWSGETLLALLDEVTKKYAVDTKRIYLTGLSMGGYGTWSLGLEHPEKFAAIAPICGGGDPLGVLLPDPKKREALKSLPVWAFHGAKDEVVRPGESERMINALRRIGNEARLTIYPEAGHDSWTETYDNPALYDWFLAHTR